MVIRNVSTNDINSLKLIKPTLELNTINNRLERQLKKEVEFLILENKGKPVCFVLLKWNGKETHPEYPDIEDLYTKESERGKGYGSKLIAECEKRSKEKGFNKIGLAVNPDKNCSAYRLYLTLGFEPTNEKPYIDGVYNGVEDWCIDMEKSLN